MTFERMPSGMRTVLIVLALESVVFFVLAIYIDQVIDTGFGVPRHPLWMFGFDRERIGTGDIADAETVAGRGAKPEDVVNEEERVSSLVGLARQEQDAVMTSRLKKIYPASSGTKQKCAVQV